MSDKQDYNRRDYTEQIEITLNAKITLLATTFNNTWKVYLNDNFLGILEQINCSNTNLIIAFKFNDYYFVSIPNFVKWLKEEIQNNMKYKDLRILEDNDN